MATVAALRGGRGDLSKGPITMHVVVILLGDGNCFSSAATRASFSPALATQSEFEGNRCCCCCCCCWYEARGPKKNKTSFFRFAGPGVV